MKVYFLQRGTAALSKVFEYLRNRGVLETAKIILHRPIVWYWDYIDRKFDRMWGTDTSGKIELDWLDIASDRKNEGYQYEPTSIEFIRFALDQIDTTRYSQFVDYGSGKGRVLLVASDYKFSRILGVEFSRELHEIAQRNIEIYNNLRQRCADIESVCMDALDFVPPTESSVLFFYEPFKYQVMQKVLEKIKISASQNRTVMAIIYIGLEPKVIEYFDTFGWRKQDLGTNWNFRRTLRFRLFIYSRN